MSTVSETALQAQNNARSKSSGLDGEAFTNGHNESMPANAWSSPGPAAFDFRSDVVTTPTPSMLQATIQTTLLDDVFREDPTTNSLETYVATLTGHEAGLLVTSGTMGNQISLRALLTQPPHSVLLDRGSHVFGWEAGGVANLCGALCIPVTPANGHHITLQDVKREVVLGEDVHACPTRVICLENTLAGMVMPLGDCREIADWARKQTPEMAVHCDGARLWEAVAAGAGSLKDYASCFTSLSLCFSKGLGAPIGSIIVGSHPFITRARHIRKSIGGGLRQSGLVTAAARVAVAETFLGGLLTQSHERALRVARMWEERGGRLSRGTETNMCWLDLEGSGVEAERWVEEGVREGVKVGMGRGRLVVHYQISDEAVERLGRVMDTVLGQRKDVNGAPSKELQEEAATVTKPVTE